MELGCVLGGGGYFRHQAIEVTLGSQEQRGATLVLYRGARQTKGRGGFVQRADGFNARVVLGHAALAQQAGGAVVAFTRVERHGWIIISMERDANPAVLPFTICLRACRALI